MPEKKKKLTNQELIRALLKNEHYRKNLVYLAENDSFLFYDEGNEKYYYLNDKDIHTFILNYISENFPDFNITQSLLKDLLYLIKLMIPMNLDKENINYINFKDCSFNLKTFDTEEKGRDKVTTLNLNFTYNEVQSTKTPHFDKYIRTTFVDERGKTSDSLIKIVQEMIGSILIPDVACSRAWFLVGNGANGKTVLTDLMESIFPQEAVSAMNLEALTTERFSLQYLVGRRLNISSEEESRYIKSDKFKALIFGDTVSAERKYGGTFKFRPRAKFMFTTNRMPSMGSIDGGLKRRMMIVPFNRHFKPQERDFTLNQKFQEELPGIIRFALDGAIRLLENNYQFTESEIMNKEMQTFIEDSSSAVGFINDRYIIDLEKFVAVNELYEEYQQWCYKNGKKYVNKSNFLKDITDHFRIERQRARVRANTNPVYALPLISKSEYDQINQDINF